MTQQMNHLIFVNLFWAVGQAEKGILKTSPWVPKNYDDNLSVLINSKDHIFSSLGDHGNASNQRKYTTVMFYLKLFVCCCSYYECCGLLPEHKACY